MTQRDRLYKLKGWLDSGRCVRRDFLLRELEVSPQRLVHCRENGYLDA